MSSLNQLVDRARESVAVDAALTLTLDETKTLAGVSAIALQVDPDYSNRQGYDSGFLGVEVPLPSFARQELADDRVPVDGTDHELRYHHFSVVMSASRRLALFTAVNIDGDHQISIDRDADNWIFDPRIPVGVQIGDDLYEGNALDRGHLVRRMDPNWGTSVDQAMRANDDTFHFTNCSPQHEDFNRSSTAWKGLEDYILTNASKANRVNVFSGPVLADTDPDFQGVRIPERFWKVVTTVRPDDTVSATAYLLSQEELISALEVGFEFGPFRTFQVPVATIEQLTGLAFGLAATVEPQIVTPLGAEGRELLELTEIQL
jgi:endonuclease G